MKLLYDDKTKKLIIQDSTPLEYKQVQIWLERQVKDYQYTVLHKRFGWDGMINLFNKGKINFGLWKEVLTALQVVEGTFEVVNKKDFPINRTVTLELVSDFCKVFFKNRTVTDKDGVVKPFYPYEHQIEAAYNILKNRYCSSCLPTSSGKTLVLSIVVFYMLRYINPDAKILLIVPNVSLVTQFYDDIEAFNLGFNKENENPVSLKIQEIMGDHPRKWRGEGEPNIYISTYQSLSKIENFGEDFYKQFYTVMVDEAHQAKIESIKKILNLTMNTAEYRFGVSGSYPKADDINWLIIQSLTGAMVTKVKTKHLQDLGIITPIKIKCIYANHNNPEIEENLKKMRKNPNLGAEAYRMEGDFIRRSEKRVKLIWKIIDKIESNTLILFNSIDYGTKIKEMLEIESVYSSRTTKIQSIDDPNIGEIKQYEFLYVDGDVSKKDREEIKRKMELDDGIIRVLVASYGTFSTGISVNNIHNIILAEGFKAEARIIQSLGRALRLHPNKKYALIFDIIDVFISVGGRNIYQRHGETRKQIYKEHEYPFEIMKINL